MLQVAAGLFAFHFFVHVLRVLCLPGEETGLALFVPAGPFRMRPAELLFGLSLLYALWSVAAIRAVWERGMAPATRWICLCLLVASLGSVGYMGILMATRGQLVRSMEQVIARMQRAEAARRERLVAEPTGQRLPAPAPGWPEWAASPAAMTDLPLSDADADLLELRAQIQRLRQSVDWVGGRDRVGD